MHKIITNMKKFIQPYLVLAIVTMCLVSSCTNYGKKVSHDYLEVYYKEGITKEQAQRTVDYLYPVWMDEGAKTRKKSIQLTKSGDSINFRMVTDQEKLAKIESNDIFYSMAQNLSDSIFNGAPVNLDLTDKQFKTVRRVTFKKMEVNQQPENTNLPPSAPLNE
ncbi:MAG TPA: hypothetical protein VLJ68_09810 [Chitinophagaceae bacterium]|nr:hypothetical protein [Chitinophagaceae bacterium]